MFTEEELEFLQRSLNELSIKGVDTAVFLVNLYRKIELQKQNEGLKDGE